MVKAHKKSEDRKKEIEKVKAEETPVKVKFGAEVSEKFKVPEGKK